MGNEHRMLVALWSTIPVAVIGALVSLAVAWRNSRTQRDLAEAAEKSKSEAAQWEAAVAAIQAVLEANNKLIDQLQEDNDALRETSRVCEGRVTQIRADLHDAEDTNAKLRRGTDKP